MTREEAIARIKDHKIVHKMNEPRAIYISEALDMAIKALEHPEQNVIAVVPCEDTISRQAVLEKAINVPIAKVVTEDTVLYRKIVFADDIENLPSVTPKQRWIPVSERLPDKYTYTLWCASSGYVRSDYFNGEFWEDAKKYCYEVIAWMPLPKPYEPQESE